MKAEYVDHMGDDLTVVNAARVSFDKESVYENDVWGHPDFEKPSYLSGKDKKLISYLATHNHWTPFSHAQITLRETVPIFVARQRFKHTVGFTYNEISRRYVDDTPEFFNPDTWRAKADDKKQGSSDTEVVDLDEYFDAAKCKPSRLNTIALETYNELLRIGVAPEQARMVLPQSMYTSYYVTGSLAAFARAYKLRSDPHSQQEIQQLASHWNEIIAPLYPVSWEALAS